MRIHKTNHTNQYFVATWPKLRTPDEICQLDTGFMTSLHENCFALETTTVVAKFTKINLCNNVSRFLTQNVKGRKQLKLQSLIEMSICNFICSEVVVSWGARWVRNRKRCPWRQEPLEKDDLDTRGQQE